LCMGSLVGYEIFGAAARSFDDVSELTMLVVDLSASQTSVQRQNVISPSPKIGAAKLHLTRPLRRGCTHSSRTEFFLSPATTLHLSRTVVLSHIPPTVGAPTHLSTKHLSGVRQSFVPRFTARAPKALNLLIALPINRFLPSGRLICDLSLPYGDTTGRGSAGGHP
jgi:hypothetical protein